MAGGSVLGADALIQGDVPCGAVREAVCSAEVVLVTKPSPNNGFQVAVLLMLGLAKLCGASPTAICSTGTGKQYVKRCS